jgi:hypothetical protein
MPAHGLPSWYDDAIFTDDFLIFEVQIQEGTKPANFDDDCLLFEMNKSKNR